MIFCRDFSIGSHHYGNNLKNVLFTFSNVDIRFANKKLIIKIFIIQILCLFATTKKVEFLEKNEFAIAVFDQDNKMLERYGILSRKTCVNAEPLYLSCKKLDSLYKFVITTAPKFIAVAIAQ